MEYPPTRPLVFPRRSLRFNRTLSNRYSVLETWHDKSCDAENTCSVITCLLVIRGINLQLNQMQTLDFYSPFSDVLLVIDV